MINGIDDLKFDEGKIVSTTDELLQYMVNGFTEDVMHYRGVGEDRAIEYRNSVIKDLKCGKIPSGLHFNLSLFRLGMKAKAKDVNTHERV